jgi:putative protease
MLVAKVIEKISDTEYKLAVRNKIYSGEELEVVTTTTEKVKINLPKMQLIGKHGELTEVEDANPNSFVIVKFEDAVSIERLDMIRRVK